MNAQTLKETHKRELPDWPREDPAFRTFELDLKRREYADRVDTEDRFSTLRAELRQDRARADQGWEANQAELKEMREASKRNWQEQHAKWEANQAALKRLHDEWAMPMRCSDKAGVPESLSLARGAMSWAE